MTKETDLIKQIAEKTNTSPEVVYCEMRIAIDKAWGTSSQIRKLFKTKPTPEEFILVMAALVKNEL